MDKDFRDDPDRWVFSSKVPKKRERLPKPKFYTSILVLDSDWIQAIQYDPSSCVLDATLKNGSRYRYRQVDSELFALVVTAQSRGAAFNQYLKPRPFTRLPSQRK